MRYRIHYPEKPNMGDLLNKYMLEEIFHIQVERSDALNSNMSAIGSGLYLIQWSDHLSRRVKQVVHYPFAASEYHVWGTGFIGYGIDDRPFYFRNINFHCLRGKLTRDRAEKITGKTLDIPLADGGLLAERWVSKPAKKYCVGIIPHFREKDHHLIKELKAHYDDSVVIDLSEDPKLVVETIGSCEYILSSSLHGLIVADSFHIPNLHIMLYPMGERIMGDGFKFADYYSGYDLIDDPYTIDLNKLPTLGEIAGKYKVKESDIEKKKDQLMKVFPK